MHDNFWRLVIKWTCTIRSISFHPKAWNNGNFIGISSLRSPLCRLCIKFSRCQEPYLLSFISRPNLLSVPYIFPLFPVSGQNRTGNPHNSALRKDIPVIHIFVMFLTIPTTKCNFPFIFSHFAVKNIIIQTKLFHNNYL